MKACYHKLKAFTLREPIRNVVIVYDPELGAWGIWPLGKGEHKDMLTSHNRRRECYRSLRRLGYVQQTRSLWSCVTDRVTNARAALSAGAADSPIESPELERA